MGIFSKNEATRKKIRLKVQLGAQERTRTSTELPPRAPEARVSTNFTTWANQNLLPNNGFFAIWSR